MEMCNPDKHGVICTNFGAMLDLSAAEKESKQGHSMPYQWIGFGFRGMYSHGICDVQLKYVYVKDENVEGINNTYISMILNVAFKTCKQLMENGSDVSCQIKDLKSVGRPENMSMAGALDYLYCSIKNKNNSQYGFMAFRAYKT